MCNPPTCTPMDDTGLSLTELETLVSDIRIVNYANVASLAWLTYDVILTFGEESSTIWRSKFSIPKVLYLLLRYVVLITLSLNLAVNTSENLSPEVCGPWMRFQGLDSVAIASWLGEALLMLRVWALYERSRKVLIFSLFLYLVDMASGLMAAFVTYHSESQVPPIPGLSVPGCYLSLSAPTAIWSTYVGWLVHAFVNTVYFALTMHKFVKGIRWSDYNLRQFEQFAPLLSLFVRDGTFYFFIILVCTLYNLIIMFFLFHRPVFVVGMSIMAATYAVTSSRVVLDLRSSITPYEFDTQNDLELVAHRARLSGGPVEFASRSRMTDYSEGQGP
ncbi:hypothetical protein JAAARDRAFT_207789 [Jaapia argillacea MUCL 33604]|uniref:DUF6533 domain-containing protein n=1 Tax=Jaapia argillacea MUCL 33604 TaxID=933084 RepID=A0A067PPI8_9AGAM|nr:hypothetical protein JAAARDRAFT_207789 [Jaapia argillacea MUCL 33604]